MFISNLLNSQTISSTIEAVPRARTRVRFFVEARYHPRENAWCSEASARIVLLGIGKIEEKTHLVPLKIL